MWRLLVPTRDRHTDAAAPMHATRPGLTLVLLSAGALVASCGEGSEVTAPAEVPFAPATARSDGVSDGNDHFYFLPPAVPQPVHSGTFDASLSPTVEICESDEMQCLGDPLATYTMSSGPGSEQVRLEADEEHYLVNWHTTEFELSSEKVYRIVVRVARTELGHLDVRLGATGGELRNIDTDKYIALKDGRTLPIRFRIEQDAVFVIGADGGSFTARDGRVMLSIPVGALMADVGITVQPSADPPATEGIIAGTTWDFGPAALRFDVPAVLTLGYNPAALPSAIRDPRHELLIVSPGADGLWEERPVTVTPSPGLVSGPIGGFSRKAVGVRTHTVTSVPAVTALHADESVRLAVGTRTAGGDVLDRRAVSMHNQQPDIVRVDTDGSVVPLAPGSATIVASPRLPTFVPADACALGFENCTFPSATSEITVVPAVITPATLSLEERETAQLAFSVPGPVSWTSSAPDIMSVDENGLATAHQAGTATITGTSVDFPGFSAAAEAEVTSAVGPIVRIEIQPDPLLLLESLSGRLTARAYDAADRELTDVVFSWARHACCAVRILETEPSRAVTIQAANSLSSLPAGTATTVSISATADGVSGFAMVEVRPITGQWTGTRIAAFPDQDIPEEALEIDCNLGGPGPDEFSFVCGYGVPGDPNQNQFSGSFRSTIGSTRDAVYGLCSGSASLRSDGRIASNAMRCEHLPPAEPGTTIRFELVRSWN